MKNSIKILVAIFTIMATQLQAQWALTGNAGTNPAINFVGTTDAQPLIFKVAGNQAGKISSPVLSFGIMSGVAITTGIENSFYGNSAGNATTTGSSNCFFGGASGLANTTGSGNNYFGQGTGATNTTGSRNNLFGHSAGANNIASDNSFFGHVAGSNNSSGAFNCFFGSIAGLSNTTGQFNSFFGMNSGKLNTTATANSFFGYQSGENTSTGFANTFIGANAGNTNTLGNNNTCIGDGANVGNNSLVNASAIGADAVVTQSNSLILGNNANVGIGVSAPTSKLHVVGNIRMVDGNQAIGKILISDANGMATWQTLPATNPTGAANGDLSGTYPNPIVDGLRGISVAATAPTNGQVLQYNGTAWAPTTISSSTGWALTGNAGTNPAINFIGTTDAQPLLFKMNNTNSGIISVNNTAFGVSAGPFSSGVGNSFFGSNAGSSTVIGTNNTFVGNGAGAANNANDNSFFGSLAGNNNTTGIANCFFGRAAGSNNISGTSNSFFGFQSGVLNTASGNSFFGSTSGTANTTGSGNSFFGNSSGQSNSTGINNSFFGANAGLLNTASNNCFFGTFAGDANTIGTNNSFFGLNAGGGNTFGNRNAYFGSSAGFSANGSDNVFVGHQAAQNATTAIKNSYVGSTAGMLNTTGSENTFSGFNAGASNTKGNKNIAIGSLAGNLNDSNTTCTFVGYDADNNNGTDYTNSMALGNASRITASNQVRIGNATVTSIGGFVNYTNVSDGRFKKNVTENVPGMEFINKLRPVTYNLDVNAINQFLKIEEVDACAVAAKEKQIQTGFIAQEVEEAAMATGYQFSGVDAPQSNEDFYGLRYAEFVVPMVKGLQQLDAANANLKSEVDNLKSRLEKLEALLYLKDAELNKANFQKMILESDGKIAVLGQNIPNPFTGKTVINYYLPHDAKNAMLTVTTTNGIVINKMELTNTGTGTIEIDATRLASGIYYYSLQINGKLVDTKQFLIQ